MMSYARKFLLSRGESAVIERIPQINTKVSIKRSTRSSRDLGAREGYWEGLIPIAHSLQSGEIITIRDGKFLVQSVNYDHASEETAFFAAKCNAVLQHKRYIEDTDDDGHIIHEWIIINCNISCFGEIITYRLRQEDPGLLDGTKYTFQIPKSSGIELLDRLVFNGTNYQVSSIDDIGMDGVVRVQAESDLRP